MKLNKLLYEIKLQPPNLYKKISREENVNVLKHFFKVGDDKIKAKIALNPNTPIEILYKCAKSENELVRNQLIFNKNLPDEIKQYLIENEPWIGNVNYICKYFYLTTQQLKKIIKEYNFSDEILENIKNNKTLNIDNKELRKIYREAGIDESRIKKIFYR